MTTQMRECKTSYVAHVKKFVAYAKSCLNEARYYPPLNGYRYMVALALYSKCITVAEAAISLLESGFPDESFGMTRTLVDIFFTLRYIGNKNADERAKLYYQFFAKDSQIWSDEVIPKYWPASPKPLDWKTKKIAASYPSPHKWSGKTARDMAFEPDTTETDPNTGKPMEHDFAYLVVYRWTSHYVHPTIISLTNHLVQAGHDNFVVNSKEGKKMGNIAAFNIASYLINTMVVFYRCMGDPQPPRLGTWAGAIMKHLARRHTG